jgi:peptidoglycan/LPS O-acetylase OafA/YrhL
MENMLTPVELERSIPDHSASHSVRPKFYYPQLDCLRFMAFFLVFLHHNIPTNARVLNHLGPRFLAVTILLRDTVGFGLSLFFFLSSYLITSLLIMERRTSGTINLKSFYVRRILRIWPLYFAFLGGVALVGHWRAAEHISLPRFAAMSVLAGNWYCTVAGLGAFAIGPLWSISVEEQFYAIWPGVFRSASRKTFLWFTGGVALISIVSTGILAARGASSLGLWMNSLSEFAFFAGGGLFALMVPSIKMPNWRYALTLTGGGAVLWFVVEIFCKINDRDLQPTPIRAIVGYLLVAIGCALLLRGSLYLAPGAIPEWLIYLGKISYGLYVFHSLAMHIVRSSPASWPIRIPGVDLLTVLLITVALAALSYKFLEKPFLQLKGRFESVRTRSA